MRVLPFLEGHIPDGLIRGILEVGYRIPFTKVPHFQGIRQTPLTGKYADMLLEEVSTLSRKGAIEPVPRKERDGYYSTYFLVPKKTGDLRPILNLKNLNLSLVKPSFKMETLTSVIRGLKPGD